MANYIPKNSLDQPGVNTSDQEKREKQEAVVSGATREKKKSRLARIKEEFISEDRDNIVDYMLFDVLIPAFKDTIITMFQNGVEMLFNGRSGYRNSRNYSRLYNEGRSSYRQYLERDIYSKPRISSGYKYNEVLFESLEDAEHVLFRMQEILKQYQVVEVAAYLELSGEDSSWIDQKYGWTSLYGVRVVKDRSYGYYLNLPRPMALE